MRLGVAVGLDSTRSTVAAAGARASSAQPVGGGFGGRRSPAPAAAQSFVVAPGAVVVHLSIGGEAAASPAAIGQAVSSAVTPSLARLAREVARVKRR